MVYHSVIVIFFQMNHDYYDIALQIEGLYKKKYIYWLPWSYFVLVLWLLSFSLLLYYVHINEGRLIQMLAHLDPSPSYHLVVDLAFVAGLFGLYCWLIWSLFLTREGSSTPLALPLFINSNWVRVPNEPRPPQSLQYYHQHSLKKCDNCHMYFYIAI